MGKLTTKARNSMASGLFALPGQRAYPIEDRAHAANAKARATQQVARGNLSASGKAKIDAAANKVLKGKR